MEPIGRRRRVIDVSDADEESFRRFVAGATTRMARLAYLLCGDRHLAEDLVQNGLIKLYRVWPKIRQPEAVDGYVRTLLLRCWLDEQRRPWRRSESRDGVVPDVPDEFADPIWGVMADERTEALRHALQTVPPRQKAVLILRYFEQLSVAETATTLRCSEGTVKSRAARGMAALRAALPETTGSQW